jgi:nicotinamidase-related amidase
MLRGFETGRKPALIISELQRGVVGPETLFPALAQQVAQRGVLAKTAALADAFRAAGLPVVHCHVVHRPDFAGVTLNSLVMVHSRKTGRMVEGDVAVEPMAEVAPQKSDFVCRRGAGLTPFYDNSLDLTLRALGVTTVVICGVSSDVAIPGTALGAVERLYQTLVAEDCVAGSSAESHNFMMKEFLRLIATVSSSAQIVDALQAL